MDSDSKKYLRKYNMRSFLKSAVVLQCFPSKFVDGDPAVSIGLSLLKALATSIKSPHGVRGGLISFLPLRKGGLLERDLFQIRIFRVNKN